MTTRPKPLLEGALTGTIIRLFFRVYDRLGYGFLESVYCEALAIEFEAEGIPFLREARVEAWYEGRRVGHFRVDFLMAKRVIVEAKARERLVQADRDQLLNYLSCSTLEVGMLLHFGPRARFERRVHSNSRKRHLPSG